MPLSERRNPARNAAYALALLIPAALMGGALIAQFGFGLFPCQMCWWQRYPHIAAIMLALLAQTRKGRGMGDLAVTLAALCVLASGLIGAFHAGVEYHWWEGLTTCSSSKIEGNALDAIMNAPLVRCDTAPWTLLGISLAGFNFLISTSGAVLVLALLGRGRRSA